MADFCADDPRLIAVGQAYWVDPERTRQQVTQAIDAGCGAVLVLSHPGRGLSPTHPDYVAVWSTLEERDIPLCGPHRRRREHPRHGLHGPPPGSRAVPPALVLDGVLDAHTKLSGGCIEMGAMWVVPWLRRLDLAQSTFKRTEPRLAALPMAASEYVHRQLWFTPFPTERSGG